MYLRYSNQLLTSSFLDEIQRKARKNRYQTTYHGENIWMCKCAWTSWKLVVAPASTISNAEYPHDYAFVSLQQLDTEYYGETKTISKFTKDTSKNVAAKYSYLCSCTSCTSLNYDVPHLYQHYYAQTHMHFCCCCPSVSVYIFTRYIPCHPYCSNLNCYIKWIAWLLYSYD